MGELMEQVCFCENGRHKTAVKKCIRRSPPLTPPQQKLAPLCAHLDNWWMLERVTKVLFDIRIRTHLIFPDLILFMETRPPPTVLP